MVRMYRASQGLVDLLLAHGFNDDTARCYPEHFKRLKLNGYNPYTMKRIFSHPKHGDYLLFHYVYMILHHEGNFTHTEERQVYTEEEARSLLAFYQLSPQLGHEWLEAYTNALDLHKYYQSIQSMPDFYNTPLDEAIKTAFESVQIGSNYSRLHILHKAPVG